MDSGYFEKYEAVFKMLLREKKPSGPYGQTTGRNHSTAWAHAFTS
jgi:hypothetical protein